MYLECICVECDGFFEFEIYKFYKLRYVVNINKVEMDLYDEKIYNLSFERYES